MARTYIRVDLPYDSPDEVLYTSKRAYEEHLSLGSGTPLGILDMLTFHQNTVLAETHHENGRKLHARGVDTAKRNPIAQKT